MGLKQSAFLADFKRAFADHFGESIEWNGGQGIANTAGLVSHAARRRSVGARGAERFELGDMTVSYCGWKIVIEFENRELPLSNILKYWPYLRGELGVQPSEPVLLCHFSDWWSYATRRDLWEWTLSRMRIDPDRLVDIQGYQFDHGGNDSSARLTSIYDALTWIDGFLRSTPRSEI